MSEAPDERTLEERLDAFQRSIDEFMANGGEEKLQAAMEQAARDNKERSRAGRRAWHQMLRDMHRPCTI